MILPTTRAVRPAKYESAPLLDEMRALVTERCGAFADELAEARRTLNDAALQMQRGFEAMAEQIAVRDRLLRDLLACLSPGGEGGVSERGVGAFAGEAIQLMASFAERSTASAHETLERLQAVSSTLEQLSTVVGGIDRLSTQTRFLSLNAAIEAARAGDRYPAFAAIADQVQRISSETAQLVSDGLEQGIARTREHLEQVTRNASALSADFDEHAGALRAQADELDTFVRASAGAAAELKKGVAASVTALQVDDVVGQMLGRLEARLQEIEPFFMELIDLAASASGPEQGSTAHETAARIRSLAKAGRTGAPSAGRKGATFRAGTVELF